MQLIVQAYEQVNKGKGHHEAMRTVYVKDPAAEANTLKLQQFERELQALKDGQ